MRMAQQANPALTIPAGPLGQGLIFRRECQGKPLCKHGTWVIPKRQSWRNLSCYQPRLTAKRPMCAASDCQFGQNQPGNRQPVTIAPKPNKACSGIPKLSLVVWMMERSSTLGRSVQADPAWGGRNHTYDGAGRLLSDGLRSFTWNALGRLKTVQRNGQTIAGT